MVFLKQQQRQTGAKNETKYVKFYSEDGKANDAIMLKIRHLCNYMKYEVTKHELIYNYSFCVNVNGKC